METFVGHKIADNIADRQTDRQKRNRKQKCSIRRCFVLVTARHECVRLAGVGVCLEENRPRGRPGQRSADDQQRDKVRAWRLPPESG